MHVRGRVFLQSPRGFKAPSRQPSLQGQHGLLGSFKVSLAEKEPLRIVSCQLTAGPSVRVLAAKLEFTD